MQVYDAKVNPTWDILGVETNQEKPSKDNPTAYWWLSIPVKTYLHELGHKIAFTSIYTNAKPSISLFFGGFLGGSCSANFQGAPILSSLGKSLEAFSPGASRSVVAAAGPLVDLVSLLALSQFSKKSELISQIQVNASASLTIYALSGLFWDENNGHDFTRIWTNSGFMAYGAIAATCLATHVYVCSKVHPNKKISIKNAVDSLALGCTELFLRNRFLGF